MYLNPKGLALKVITEKVDSSAVRHPNGEKAARSFTDRPRMTLEDGVRRGVGPRLLVLLVRLLVLLHFGALIH